MNELKAFDLYRSQIQGQGSSGSLRTFNESFDSLLGPPGSPGIAVGRIYEISGEAGLGKTQLCMQLCSTVQLPKCLDGLDGKAIYLDTEKSFNPNRMMSIAKATKENARQVLKLMAESAKLTPGEMEEFEERNFMDNILIQTLDSLDSLMTTLESLEKFLENDGQVKLIILDSIAFHFRYMSDEESLAIKETRTSVLAKICQIINKLAFKFKLAVVVTNQVAVKFKGSGDEGRLAPALGESYSHFPSERIMFLKHPLNPELRIARVIKSSFSPLHTKKSFKPRESFFTVTKDGIRDVLTST